MTIKQLFDTGLLGMSELVNILNLDTDIYQFNQPVSYLNLSDKDLKREVYRISAELHKIEGSPDWKYDRFIPFISLDVSDRLI